MGALETNTTLIYGVHIRESANDGSDFTNAASDYRVLFLGEDGLLHVKDSSGAVTSPYSSTGSSGTELDYVEKTSATTITATSEGTAQTMITGTSVSYAAVPYLVQLYIPQVSMASSAATIIIFDLYVDSTILGRLAVGASGVTPSDFRLPIKGERRHTPSAGSHQYIVKAWKSGTATTSVDCGAGGTGTLVPGFLRVTLV